MRIDGIVYQANRNLLRGSVAAPHPRGTTFEQTLTVVQAAPEGNTAGAPRETAPAASHVVRRGDTLSHIVLNAMRTESTRPSTADLYAAVRAVARANGLANPDIIHPGQTIDLSSILPAAAVAAAPAPPAPVDEPQAAPPLASTPPADTAPARALSAMAALPDRTPAATLTRPGSRPSFRAGRSATQRLSRPMGGPREVRADPTPFQLTASYSLLDPHLAGYLPATPKSSPALAALSMPTANTSWDALLETPGSITSEFGPRRDPFTGQPDFHAGIDIAADFGARVRPFREGVVRFSGWRPGYGKVVIVRHDDGVESVYGHNAANLVEVGERVNPESVIALLGNTGRSTGPHLHFEVRVNGRAVNPVSYLEGVRAAD
ncbi:MAG TPA: LysM peptidoglycan-binding domain-containing M23 family metallopeptidase [Candidatus Hydrogenedentes bacterium]|nr:LysM peptidoglycan-binding domain-containing M23 family metallopeptidase [Candidatus Hydrogenedentota bacterium]